MVNEESKEEEGMPFWHPSSPSQIKENPVAESFNEVESQSDEGGPFCGDLDFKDVVHRNSLINSHLTSCNKRGTIA